MPYIKIRTRPTGSAPPEIREQWIGVEIKVFEGGNFGFIRAIDGGPADEKNIVGYDVTLVDAVAALRKAGRNIAANWWGSQKRILHLRFGKEFCDYYTKSGE